MQINIIVLSVFFLRTGFCFNLEVVYKTEAEFSVLIGGEEVLVNNDVVVYR